ncbi:uncharacterized protein N0V89_008913 [Didymosphaeria variabile]|uniref:Oxidase ustYa n=1 Tax=Didymosphaeria variabile TaxID=1932322 RepID=A0A9W8XHN4_9PLEO|nr:uncharacterized protein N0V89_008913 [Didymosphaeria variabile]KAJ4350292.1 hypothetical protein N0V89_008913 [Didymosphaeria variabile]
MGVASETETDGRYKALRNLESHSDSDTDVEDWEDGADTRPRRSKRRNFWRKIKLYRWMLDTALLLVIVGFLVERRWKPRKGHLYELAGDMTGFSPTFSQQIVSFKPDPIFAPENASDFWSRETQKAWLDIVPEGLGYVEVKEPSQYSNLPKPIHDYTSQAVFTTSMTHQLHCLYTILDAYNTVRVSAALGFQNEVKMPWHIDHCFDYIRQAIMCAGDVALEGAATTFPGDPITGEDLGGSDGWDAKHVCKDYSQVYEYLEKRTINHVKWIKSEE